MSHVSRTKRGFTLIELLVVIAVIAVLMGILMPSLKKARDSAKAISCQSNLRQWGLSWSMYLQDNNSRFTPGYKQGESWYLWLDLITPYFKNEKMFSCPATKTHWNLEPGTTELWGNTREGWRLENPTTNRQFYGSYGYNYWVSSQNADAGRHPKENHWGTDLIKAGSDVPIFADCTWIGGFPYDNEQPRPNEEYTRGAGGEMGRFVLNRHAGNVNVILMDQSMRKVRVKSLWSLKWHREFNINNPLTKANAKWPDWLEKLP